MDKITFLKIGLENVSEMFSNAFLSLELVGLLLVGLSIPIFLFNLTQLERNYSMSISNILISIAFSLIGLIILEETERLKQTWFKEMKSILENKKEIDIKNKTKKLESNVSKTYWYYKEKNKADKPKKEETPPVKEKKEKKIKVDSGTKCKYCGLDLGDSFEVVAVGNNLLRFCSKQCAGRYQNLVKEPKKT